MLMKTLGPSSLLYWGLALLFKLFKLRVVPQSAVLNPARHESSGEEDLADGWSGQHRVRIMGDTEIIVMRKLPCMEQHGHIWVGFKWKELRVSQIIGGGDEKQELIPAQVKSKVRYF